MIPFIHEVWNNMERLPEEHNRGHARWTRILILILCNSIEMIQLLLLI